MRRMISLLLSVQQWHDILNLVFQSSLPMSINLRTSVHSPQDNRAKASAINERLTLGVIFESSIKIAQAYRRV